MKRHATKSVRLGGAFWDGGAETIINKGVNGRWRELLSKDESSRCKRTAVEFPRLAPPRGFASAQRARRNKRRRRRITSDLRFRKLFGVGLRGSECVLGSDNMAKLAKACLYKSFGKLQTKWQRLAPRVTENPSPKTRHQRFEIV